MLEFAKQYIDNHPLSREDGYEDVRTEPEAIAFFLDEIIGEIEAHEDAEDDFTLSANDYALVLSLRTHYQSVPHVTGQDALDDLEVWFYGC